MESDDEIIEKYKQDSEQIIKTLQFISDPKYFCSLQNCVALEKVLHMIATNLTFNDPGIFLNKILADPKSQQLQETFNMWLNNQIVFIYCNTENER